jgi:hypothetical protein
LYGGLEVYRKAITVWVGETPRYVKPGEEELRFGVDKSLNGLQQYLTKRNIGMDTFSDLLVLGKMPPQDVGLKVYYIPTFKNTFIKKSSW